MRDDAEAGERRDKVWQGSDVVDKYIRSSWQTTPLAREQIDVMLRVISTILPNGPERFIDLGCGAGNVGEAILQTWKGSRGFFLDFSKPMLTTAEKVLNSYGDRVILVEQDYGDPTWVEHPAISALQPYDTIVSGYSIHHQPHPRKREIYAEIASLLRPGGVFINIERVASPTKLIESVHDNLMIDMEWQYKRQSAVNLPREAVARGYFERPEAQANILLDTETQMKWLSELGFVHVDCYLKIFEIAVFGGMKRIGS